LELLLERRDVERDVPSHREIALEREQKVRILQELAWQLTVFGRAEMARATALRRVAEKTATMPRITADSEAILDYLLQRSGVIHEPVPGRIDFVHRTVQEYLAAAQAADNADIEPLIARAHLDQWRETIVMAAGHANAPLRHELLAGLLDRADVEPRYAHRLHMLVAACLETIPDIPTGLRDRVENCIRGLIPPKNVTEARPLSTGGEDVIGRLPDSLEGLSTGEAVATVRTAWMINGPQALGKLAGYGTDPRARVQDELITGWEYFEPTEYARRVLADAPLHKGRLRTQEPKVLPSTPLLRRLRQLEVRLPKGVDLDCLAGFPALTSIGAQGATADSMRALAEHKKLWNIWLFQIPGAIDDVSLLLGLPKLRSLYLYADQFAASLSFLRRLPRLRYLGLSSLDDTRDFAAVSEQDALRGLWLFGCPGLTDVTTLKRLTRLKMLSLRGARLGRSGLDDITSCFPQLNTLQLRDSEWLTDLGPVSGLPLRNLIIGQCPGVNDIGPVRQLGRLRYLSPVEAMTLEQAVTSSTWWSRRAASGSSPTSYCPFWQASHR
jgi:hypothetical protein